METAFITRAGLGISTIDKACAKLGLQLTMKGALKSLPENVHWHYKMPHQPGVLEITLLPQENKVLFACKKNRNGKWVDETTQQLKQLLKLTEVST